MYDDRGELATLEGSAGRLSLDFANTADWHASEEPVEYLTSYEALVSWGQRVGVLNGNQAGQLIDFSLGRAAETAAVLERAIALREVVYRIFSAVCHGEPPAGTDLDAFNMELSAMLAQAGIARRAGGFTWDWAGADDALDRMLWPVLHDAAQLLTSRDLDRVGQCADEQCGWLFLDQSRNRSRRWCSMGDCGNRAKARRYYRRSRAGQDSRAGGPGSG